MKNNNILTYSYKGLMSLIYLIMGKKDKISQLYAIEENKVVLNDNAFVDESRQLKKEYNQKLAVDKLHFRYKARNKQGKIINSTFDAYSVDQAKKFLTQEGLEILEIKLRSKYDFDMTFGKVLSVSELAFALTQLSTYIKAGITLIDSVRILAKQTVSAPKRKVYELIIYDLLAGESLSDSLSKQPKVFPKLLVNMIKTAELTGDIAATLDEMAEYYTSMDRTRKDIKGAMTYPVIVLCFSVIVVAFVLIWVVPQYEKMFSGQGLELPTITKITLNVSSFLKTNIIFIILIIVLILATYMYLYKHVHIFKKFMQTFYLHIPVLKNIITYSEISMFSRTFSSLLNHGVHITDSMDVLLKITDNEVYRGVISKTVSNLNAGGKISDAFKDNWAIPIVAYEMVVTGENTGQLGVMLSKVADYYESLYKTTISQLKSLLEPILIVFLAGSIGVIILSIILPMFQMYQALS